MNRERERERGGTVVRAGFMKASRISVCACVHAGFCAIQSSSSPPHRRANARSPFLSRGTPVSGKSAIKAAFYGIITIAWKGEKEKEKGRERERDSEGAQ